MIHTKWRQETRVADASLCLQLLTLALHCLPVHPSGLTFWLNQSKTSSEDQTSNQHPSYNLITANLIFWQSICKTLGFYHISSQAVPLFPMDCSGEFLWDWLHRGVCPPGLTQHAAVFYQWHNWSVIYQLWVWAYSVDSTCLSLSLRKITVVPCICPVSLTLRFTNCYLQGWREWYVTASPYIPHEAQNWWSS